MTMTPLRCGRVIWRIIPNVPATAATVTVGKTLTTKEGTNAYRGETADLATSGLKTISVYVTVDDVSGSTVNVSYGFGIGLDASPWWIELDHGKFTQTPADPDDTGFPGRKSDPLGRRAAADGIRQAAEGDSYR